MIDLIKLKDLGKPSQENNNEETEENKGE